MFNMRQSSYCNSEMFQKIENNNKRALNSWFSLDQVCWQPPAGLLNRCPNLKAIQAMGAGVDSLLCDSNLPKVPILRIIDPLMAERMATWVVWSCINIQVCLVHLQFLVRSDKLYLHKYRDFNFF